MIRFKLFTIFICLLLIGCKSDEQKIQLQKDDLGYDLSACLDAEKDALLNALSEDGVNVQHLSNEETMGMEFQTYTFKDTVYGLEYDVILYFTTYDESEDFLFAFYEKSLSLKTWPEGEIADNIQNTYSALKEKYGQETDSTDIRNEHNICEEQVTKSISWNTGTYSWRTFSLSTLSEYSPVPSEYAVEVIISDESPAYRSKITSIWFD